MALTWNDARTKVRGDLWRSGTTGLPDDVCDRALHASLLELEQARRWLWLENIVDTVAMVAAGASFDVPATFRSLASVSQIRADGSMYSALTIMSLGRIRMLASQRPLNTIAENYNFSGGKVYLDGQVPIGTQFELIGTFGTPEDLDAAIAGGGANVTLTRQQTTVIAGAAWFAALTYLKNETEAARHRAVFERGLERLTDREDEQRGDNYGGCAVPDTAYRDMAGC